MLQVKISLNGISEETLRNVRAKNTGSKSEAVAKLTTDFRTSLYLSFVSFFQGSFILILLAYNALLRCEQRNTKAAAHHLNHLNQCIVKMPRVANHS